MAEIWGLIGAAVITAGAGAVAANQNNKAAQSAANAATKGQVNPPNLTSDARRAWLEQYNLAGTVAKRDMEIRQQYAPQQAKLAADLYSQYMPQFARTNMATLKRIDPESIAGRKALYSTVFDELQAGRSMTDETSRQITQAARGALAARGNNLGNAAALAEATHYGIAGDNALQTRIANMGNFLRNPTPQSHFNDLLGGASPAVSGMLAGAVQPGTQYVEGPSYWRTAADNAWRQYGATSDNAQRMGAMNAAAAGAQENPWLAALGGAAGVAVGAYNSGAIGTGKKTTGTTGNSTQSWQTNARSAYAA